MILRTSSITSNASRKVTMFTSLWFNKSRFNPLYFRKKWLSGRSSLTGKIILRSKTSTLRRINLPKVHYSFRTVYPGIVSTLKLVPFSNKLLALTFFPSGSCSFFPALEKTSLFSVFSFRTLKLNFSRWNRHSSVSLIYHAPKFRKVSNVELRPGFGAQYARSAGTSAKIIKVDPVTHLALVKLPSGVRKFFSLYGTVMLGPCALKLKRKISNTRSGYWRSFGLKGHVRGVAMNPVDHPHGGRTKAIKYPRTPWGTTAKKK